MRRRVAALFALLCVAAMPFELLAPDVHDADGIAASVLGGGDQGHRGTNPSGEPADRIPLPTHSTHVDHCAHAHLAGLIAAEVTPQSSVARSSVPDTPSQRLLSVSAPPHQRPPIA